MSIAAAADGGSEVDRSPTGLRILLVEDHFLIAKLIECILSKFGHQVVGPVAEVDKAVEIARVEALDLALLDIELRGREVYPVADALDARSIPFVFVTGYGADALRPAYRDRPTLAKPFRQHDLHEALGAALGG